VDKRAVLQIVLDNFLGSKVQRNIRSGFSLGLENIGATGQKTLS